MTRDVWMRWLSDLLVVTGVLVVCASAFAWAESALAARQLVTRPYLESHVGLSLELLPSQAPSALAGVQPAATPVVSPSDSPAPLPAPGVMPEASLPQGPASGGVPLEPTPAQPAGETLPADPTAVAPVAEIPQAYPAPAQPLPTELAPAPVAPAPVAPAGQPSKPVIRLVIPSLNIDRAVVPVNMRGRGGNLIDWNTDSLFATRNRVDLVGQPIISTNPGDGGNVILVGHNYDNGVFIWQGVFVNLKNIELGAQIQVYTEGGGLFTYQVQRVKKVPWADQNAEELARHMKFLGPQPGETLTLVTCGGANMWPWPARIYVVASPVSQ